MEQKSGTVSDWAAHCGIALFAAQQRIRRHNIPVVNGVIDFAEADAIWEASANHKQRANSRKSTDGIPVAVSNFAQLQMEREAEKLLLDRANRRIAEVEAAEKEGDVVSIPDMQVKLSDVFAQIKTRFLGLGDKLCEELSIEADPRKCSRLIERHIRMILTELADGLEVSDDDRSEAETISGNQ